ncbi:RNA-binding protein [Operophtera brumata]|uniref:RNA-binding protein n=1 Tax=Operophtera brumata TaxID=104452 RepID=A0A0L7KQ59_OPEBR|nr:RNA-binding protein [Operophtera brumata]
MAADTGMDTCSSPEITDSRKRPLDGDSENGDVKRSHFSSVQDLVTALPLANGHGTITSHFGELVRQHQIPHWLCGCCGAHASRALTSAHHVC